MAYKTCEDCGERIYNLGCVNCNEADYIAEQECFDDQDEDDSDYCDCGAVHGEEEIDGICAACGKLTE